ncbi:MAG: crossover junction endodeoxyribonuclease RuvC [Thermoanaerobaculia bacterium]
MRILGVDPGSITTGFGVVDYERGRLTLVEQGSIGGGRGRRWRTGWREFTRDCWP